MAHNYHQRKLRGNQWKTKCKEKKEKEEDAAISIGLVEWRETEIKIMNNHDA